MTEVPNLPLSEIWGRADSFRDGLGHEFAHPPLDIVYVADVVLNLDFIPLDGLWDDLQIDAALTADLKGIYVDAKTFADSESLEKTNPWVEKRFRFSIAHEIGHYELHADIIRGLSFVSEADYLVWVRNRIGKMEFQAHEFAGRLLVPPKILFEEYDRIQKDFSKKHPDWRRQSGTRELIAKKLAPRFGVNEQVIDKRLDREGIWPAE
jgi:hypothetical protein